MGRCVCLAAALLTTVALAMPAVAQALPPTTLTSEFLGAGPPTSVTNNCTSFFSGGTVTATYAGWTSGPYVGTFTETATVVYPPGGASSSVVIDAAFTITSDTTTVTGTKHTSSGFGADCESNSTFFIFSAGGFGLGGGIGPPFATYTATISTPTGAFHDEGTSFLFGDPASLGEGFVSSLLAPVPLLPTSKDQCKNGGWRKFGGVFKNQGDCVSFVVTRGKNRPG
jgi:hypothetical protein